MPEKNKQPVLAVDLDGTLMRGDLSGESLLVYLRSNPLRLFHVIRWARVSKAHVKRQLAQRVSINYAELPFQKEVVDFITSERAAGRRTCLATGSDELLVKPLADHVGCFDDVLASDGKVNKTGRDKVAALADAYGPGNYSYVGNSSVDFRVWPDCEQVYVASASNKFTEEVRKRFTIEKLFQYHGDSPKTWLRQMRVQQWYKNFLLFWPLFVGATLDVGSSVLALAGFLSLSLCSSAVYVLNDLADISTDRLDPIKRNRPIANGDMQVLVAILLIPLLLVFSVFLSAFLTPVFTFLLLIYVVSGAIYNRSAPGGPARGVIRVGFYLLRVAAGTMVFSFG